MLLLHLLGLTFNDDGHEMTKTKECSVVQLLLVGSGTAVVAAGALIAIIASVIFFLLQSKAPAEVGAGATD